MNTFLCLVFWYLNNDLCRSCCSLDFWCVELSVRGSVDKIDWRGVWEGEGRMTTHENRPSIRCWHTCGRSSSLPYTHALCWRCLLPTLTIPLPPSLSYLLSWRRRKLPLKSFLRTVNTSFLFYFARFTAWQQQQQQLQLAQIELHDYVGCVRGTDWTAWTSWQCCQSALN